MDITKWSTSKSHWLYPLQQRWRNFTQSVKTRRGADCGSDHNLLIAQFRRKWNKVWKATRPFRYDLNQIPQYYTVGVRNRFKGLDLIECLKNYGQRFVKLYRRQWSRQYQRKINTKRQSGCLRRSCKCLRKEKTQKAKRKGKRYLFECRVPKNSK